MRWLKGRLTGARNGEAGFTLIELLVVVGILAVLAAIAAPRISEVINKSKEARSKADMKVISGALERYYTDKGFYPIKLSELRTEHYVKFDVTFDNPWSKHYFYAVNDNTEIIQNNVVVGYKATAYILADPKSTPAPSGGATTNIDVGKDAAQPAVPEGPAWSDATSKAGAWGLQTPTVVVAINGTNIGSQSLAWGTSNSNKSVGAVCASSGNCSTAIITD